MHVILLQVANQCTNLCPPNPGEKKTCTANVTSCTNTGIASRNYTYMYGLLTPLDLQGLWFKFRLQWKVNKCPRIIMYGLKEPEECWNVYALRLYFNIWKQCVNGFTPCLANIMYQIKPYTFDLIVWIYQGLPITNTPSAF